MPKLKTKPQCKFLGENSRNKKRNSLLDVKLNEQELLITESNKQIEIKKKELQNLKIELSQISSEVDNATQKLSHKKQNLENITSLTSDVSNCIKAKKSNISSKVAFTISKLTASKRSLKPSTPNLPYKAKCVRRKETFEACKLIHGGKQNDEPVITGMFDTLTAKVKSDTLSTVILAQPKLSKKLAHENVKQWRKEYYKSPDNIKRSLNNYYSKNVMGKRKYQSMRKSNSRANFKGNKIPNVVPYENLSQAMNEIDIGTLIPFSPTLTHGLDESQVKEGVYRNCQEHVLRLAQFYLNVNHEREDKLKTFDNFTRKDQSSFLFLIALGGDGAPGSGMAVLISFLNVAARLPSSSENYLIFGGEVSENCEIVRRYLAILMDDIKFLESRVFEIITCQGEKIKVEFSLSELPNDMKMLAFLGGELSNSATYFSTFANVASNDVCNIKKAFGLDSKADWKPFEFKKRVSDAEKAQKKKKEICGLNEMTKSQRRRFTTYISTTLKSRQEEIPLVGEYISLAKCEPLHIKNNVVKGFFVKLLKIAVGQSDAAKFNTYKELPLNSLLVKFVEFIRKKMHCNFLASKIIQWFNESTNRGTDEFRTRFRGKESLSYFKLFPELCLLMIENIQDKTIKGKILEIFYCSILLRTIMSLVVRIEDFDLYSCDRLADSCKQLFKCCSYSSKHRVLVYGLYPKSPLFTPVKLLTYMDSD